MSAFFKQKHCLKGVHLSVSSESECDSDFQKYKRVQKSANQCKYLKTIQTAIQEVQLQSTEMHHFSSLAGACSAPATFQELPSCNSCTHTHGVQKQRQNESDYFGHASRVKCESIQNVVAAFSQLALVSVQKITPTLYLCAKKKKKNINFFLSSSSKLLEIRDFDKFSDNFLTPLRISCFSYFHTELLLCKIF